MVVCVWAFFWLSGCQNLARMFGADMKGGQFAFFGPVTLVLDSFPYFLHSNTAPVVRRSNTGNSRRYILITTEKDPLYDFHIVGVKYLTGTLQKPRKKGNLGLLI